MRGERGVGEWFGSAPFEQPAPGGWEGLRDRFFPCLQERKSRVVPSRYGESIDGLHDRLARALEAIVGEVEREYEEEGRGGEDVTVMICGHAAGIIASGRVLTGRMPEDYEEEDFKCFTCGLSRFVRRDWKPAYVADGDMAQTAENWRISGGVAGGWECLLNSGCEHLSQGEERGWHFQGDESFDSYERGTRKVDDTNEETAEGSKL